MAKTIRIAQIVLLAAGVAALSYCVAVWLDARIYQAAQTREFARELHARRQAPVTGAPFRAKPPAPRDGQAIGQLQIPRLDVSMMVVEGASDGDLRRAAGHIPGTALPGEAGNIAIAGHRDTFFRSLRRLRRGDSITLRSLAATWRYRVVSLAVVRPEDIAVLYPTRQDSLTLITCYPFTYIGAAPARYVVRARRVVAKDAQSRMASHPGAG